VRVLRLAVLVDVLTVMPVPVMTVRSVLGCRSFSFIALAVVTMPVRLMAGLVALVLVTVMAVSVVVLVAVLAASRDQAFRHELHAALGTAVRFVARNFRMHRADVRRLFCRLREQLHPALRAATRLVAHHLGMHRAGVDDGHALGHAHVHLGDERERLIRWRLQERLDAFALLGHVAIGARACELV
jgi:hypothetical protein